MRYDVTYGIEQHAKQQYSEQRGVFPVRFLSWVLLQAKSYSSLILRRGKEDKY